jgi:hypothetical protein
MSDGLPKVLPNTGATILFGLGLWGQFWLAIAVAVVVGVAAGIIRYRWRSGKTLNG